MTLRLGGLARPLAQVTAVLMLGAALSACSSVPGWVDPTTWIGGDDSSTVASSDDGLPADTQQAQADDQQQPDQQIDDQSGGDDQQPGLASIPDRPAPSSTPTERQQVSDSLAADRRRSHYSGEQLRGDSQSSAPTPDETEAAAPTTPVDTGTEQVASTSAPSSAAAVTSSGGEPAVPATSTGIVAGAPTTDAQLGFQPSKAPPLDPSIAQFVAPPILARFQQTASIGPSQAIAAPAVPAVPPAAGGSDSDGAMGGPEEMSGAVVANLDAIQPAPAAADASVYANPAGLPPSAVVFFPHDTTILNSAARQQVRAAADAFRNKGGAGFVRVVGHSSSRTANMPLSRHLTYNFERSQARATAVAKELIRDGVPADKVLVEAVGDSQPVYYESMPQGEEGNRRAEIFIQG